MESQCGSQHTRPEAQMVVDPIGLVLVVVQSGHLGADPDSDIRRYIEVSGAWIRLVLINRRAPVNRYAAQNEAEKDRHIQPVTPAHQEMMPPGHEHARLLRERARGSAFFTWGCGAAHFHVPYCPLLGAAAMN